MGISLSIKRNGQEAHYASLVGGNELREIWMPIIAKRKLTYLEHALTTGLDVTDEYIRPVLDELGIVEEELRLRYQMEMDIVNPVFRCRRARDLISKSPPSEGFEIWVG